MKHCSGTKKHDLRIDQWVCTSFRIDKRDAATRHGEEHDSSRGDVASVHGNTFHHLRHRQVRQCANEKRFGMTSALQVGMIIANMLVVDNKCLLHRSSKNALVKYPIAKQSLLTLALVEL